jgi:hypothetical protein
LSQTNWITLTAACRFNNSLGDDFAHDLRLAGIVKRFAGSLESCTHRRKRFGVKHPNAPARDWGNTWGAPHGYRAQTVLT